MSARALALVAERFLPVAALMHLALFTILVIFWIRRRGMGRVFSAYFAVAFGASAAALLGEPGARPMGLVAAGLAALWLLETIRPKNDLTLVGRPRLRLAAMAIAGAYAVAYPGYSPGLPSFVFAPLGVLLAPTLLAATALLNAIAPARNRVLHASHALAGLVVGVASLVSADWRSAPLVGVAVWAAPLILGRARVRDAAERPAGSVRAIRDRMYGRRTLLPGPREPRRRGARTRSGRR